MMENLNTSTPRHIQTYNFSKYTTCVTNKRENTISEIFAVLKSAKILKFTTL